MNHLLFAMALLVSSLYQNTYAQEEFQVSGFQKVLNSKENLKAHFYLIYSNEKWHAFVLHEIWHGKALVPFKKCNILNSSNLSNKQIKLDSKPIFSSYESFIIEFEKSDDNPWSDQIHLTVDPTKFKPNSSQIAQSGAISISKIDIYIDDFEIPVDTFNEFTLDALFLNQSIQSSKIFWLSKADHTRYLRNLIKQCL